MDFQKESLSLCSCPHYTQSPTKNKCKKIVELFLLILITFGAGVFIGDYLDKDYQPQKDYAEREIEEKNHPLFSLAWSKIEENFVYYDNIDKEGIDLAITEAMIRALGCPFSRLQIAPYPQIFVREVGLGIEKREEKEIIISMVEESSPSKNKIIVKDKLVYINNQNIQGLSLSDIANKLRGDAGTSVKISILRGDDKELKTFNIFRREIIYLPPIVLPGIDLPTVKWELKDNKIAYIQIFRFSDGLYFDFQRVVSEVINSPAKKIILDLRNNSGGDMGIVKRVSEYFLKYGDIILIEKKEREGRIEHKSNRTGELLGMEIVVLINSNTASGGEIMAGALRDSAGASLVGEKTWGKASVQRVFHLKERYSIVLTTNTWLTPKGDFIAQKGITPDYEIIGADNQLSKALNLLLD